MRKVSKKIAAAFMQRKAANNGNTRTDGDTIWLHGNAIAKWEPASGHKREGDVFSVSFAGWGSVTTRERLNSLPAVRVHQSKHEQFITHSGTGMHHKVENLRDWFPIHKVDWQRDVFTLDQLEIAPLRSHFLGKPS